MKKILLSGAAFAVIGFAATAAHAADPIKLTVGGYATLWAGYAENDSGKNIGGTTDAKPEQVAQHTDAEIKFDGSDKLDNGLVVSVEAAFNPSHTASQDVGTVASGTGNGAAKRIFGGVQGAFGDVQLGQMENVESIAHNDAPAEGSVGMSDGFWNEWVENPTNHADAWIQTAVQTNQPADKIAYTTPQFGGFQAAIDYTPDVDNGTYGQYYMPESPGTLGSNGATGAATVSGWAWHYVATWSGNVGPLTVKGDLGGMTQQYAGLQTYNAGLNVGLANGLYFAGSIGDRVAGSGSAGVSSSGGAVGDGYLYSKQQAAQAGVSWDAGVGYENGPWGVSGSYFHGSAKDYAYAANNGSPTALASHGDDTDDVWMASAGYTLGPGIKLTEDVFTVKWKTDDDVAADQNEGWAAVSGLALSF